MKVGNNAVYLKDLKGLDKGSVGVIDSIGSDYVVISYTENFKTNNKVTSHSAKFDEIEIILESKQTPQ